MNARTMPMRPERGHRRAFTLVEMLVVITLIGIIASTMLFAMFGVREDARERRARAQIARIHELLMQQWEGYRTRAVPVQNPTAVIDPRQMAGLRLNALRELMRMEMPDRKSDLLSPINEVPANTTDVPRFLKSRPALWRAHVRRARQQIIARRGLNPAAAASQDAWKNDVTGWTPEHQHAECLYLILASIRDGDNTGLEFFSEDEMGDVDNDGMFEILDPWGVPVYFLRWAPGFRSDLQPGDLNLAEDGDAGASNGDPFDILKMDPRWRDNVPYNDPQLIFPLIVSAGRDRQFDLLFDFLPMPFPSPLVSVLDYNTSASVPSPLTNLYNDPYVSFQHPTLSDPVWGNAVQIGVPADTNGDGLNGFGDNITNHFLEVR